MTTTGARSRPQVELELADVAKRRAHAARELHFDAYTSLSEEESALLEELRAFPKQRPPSG